MHERLKKIREALQPIVTKAQPAARVVMRVANAATKLNNLTPMVALSMATNGLDELATQLNRHDGGAWGMQVFLSHAQIVQALKEAGAQCRDQGGPDDDEDIAYTDVRCPGGVRLHVNRHGSLTVWGCAYDNDHLREWLRQAFDRVLGDAVEVRASRNREVISYDNVPLKLTALDNAQADEILASTLPLIEGGRCILLDGKPGVGKTTLAQIIARNAKLGRTVLLENKLVGYAMESAGFPTPAGGGGNALRGGLATISPGVIIIDDIDKVTMNLSTIEMLRSAAKLVVLTANNGSFDEVLDGALMRAGRVDEVFSIKPVDVPREAPFDRITDQLWEEVREWPVAYLNELRKRLQYRPDDVRLDDLRARMLKKTRSQDKLL